MTIHTDTRPTLNLIRLPNGQGLDLPTYETRGAAGMDLRAAIDEDKPLVLAPGKRALIPTGFVFEIPEGFEGQVRPRSGLAAKNGVTCLNAPGTVDCDYRGEVKVILVNHGEEDFTITRGMRIAQMVIAPFIQTRIVEVSETTETARGAGGFGSTGV
ncbi:dUTP diphosphatase [Rhizobium mesosinicum]|uniref:Deoxyuridine 5'-triphosphate nucleotidohydrolase n=1 Tax=Rhizobium mesosinicum TaxID=335017 RepID=A0ABS7GQW0_9HYPH|nr:dUTP diphosphatase [Rhizobium mesosinicum]MBW9052031.1 dUTP diphosphatase [Rhizobium mesosinicum]